MAATYGSEDYSVNGKTVHLKWLETTLGVDPNNDEITVRDIGANSVATSGYYGVNGVFFNMTSPYDVICFALQNGSAVRSVGDSNGHFGCLVRLSNNLSDGTFLFCKDGYDLPAPAGTPSLTFPFTHNGYAVNKSNVKWAVGGMSLCIGDSSMTQSEYNGRYNGLFSVTSNRPRTAIGYKGGMKIILCTFFDPTTHETDTGGCTPWDVRTVMIDKFDCTMGINLDGGGSTQIAYKEGGSRKTCQASTRLVRTMISVPM